MVATGRSRRAAASVAALALCLTLRGASCMMGNVNLAQTVDHARYPYLVSLRNPSTPGNPHYCNGVLVGEREVVTAAHCIDPEMGGHLSPLVYIGEGCSLCNDGACRDCGGSDTLVAVSDVLVESTWDSNVLTGGDIALLKLGEEVKGVTPAAFSTNPEAVRNFGFNFLYSSAFTDESVMHVQLLARESGLCQRLYQDDNFDIDIRPGMLCASAVGSEVCSGFSGAPLIIQGEDPAADLVVGLLSFSTEGCHLPAIYTDVSLFAGDLLEGIGRLKPGSMQQQSVEDPPENVPQTEADEDVNAGEDKPALLTSSKIEHTRYPYLVSLRNPTEEGQPHYCNGVLIGETQVVTAAHCVDPRTNGHVLPIVEIGRSCHDCEGDFLSIKAVDSQVDPSWSGEFLMSGDIALVHLETPVVGVTPATLSTDTEAVRNFGFNFLHTFTYDRTGGVSEARLLAREAMPCMREYNEAEYPDVVIHDGMLCVSSLGPDDVCRGFSGAPLIIKGGDAEEDVVVGIMSFGTVACELPAVFTDVAVYANDLLMLMNTAHHTRPKGNGGN